MKTHLLLLSLILAICIASCQKEELPKTTTGQETPAPDYPGPVDLQDISFRNSCPWVVLPAGSTDALAQAIADICEDGVIYLEAGMHTENGPVVIDKPVKIIGESGAVLRLQSSLAPNDPSDGTVSINTGLHVLDAPGTLIQDLTIEPVDDDGGTAIFVENSDGSAVIRNGFSNFQYSVVVQKSDRMAIMFNNIVASGAWQTGAISTAHGIVVVNGKSSYVIENEVSNAVFGIWACDKWGTADWNNVHNNFVGLILCNVPEAYKTPSGEVIGSETPATGWKVRNNSSDDNLGIGYLVIDGANSNRLINNEAHGNGSYDIELTTDTYRFGFLTPAAYKNTVIAGSHQDVIIKDCGIDNTIVGGILVDTSVDPCN